jgi:hypothetical protein
VKGKFGAYTHARPDGTVFYVGKGIKSRAYKLLGRNEWHDNIVKKYGKEKIIVTWYACESEEESFELEKSLIADLKKQEVVLTNQSDGDEGNSGYRWRDDQKVNIQRAIKACWQDPEYVRNVMSARKYEPSSDETKRKIGAASRRSWELNYDEYVERVRKFSSTDEFKKKCGDASRRMWGDLVKREKAIAGLTRVVSDPAYKRKRSKQSIAQWADPDYKKKTSAKINEAWSDPALLDRQSSHMKRMWEDPETRKKLLKGRARQKAERKAAEAAKATLTEQATGVSKDA